MQVFLTRFMSAVAAVGAFAAIAAAPASAAIFQLEFSGSSIAGSGSISFDTTGAPSTDPYEYRAGDTFLASFDFGSVTIDFTELHAQIPIQIPHVAGEPSDVFYSGTRDESSGDDLGLINFINLSMGEGGWTLSFLTDDGFEATVRGEYLFVQDGTEIPVPTPATAALFAGGLVALGWRSCRA
jgi:hypothetical protein